jgi:glycosyltransferase involved in cell wall biosynthesis
MPAVLAAHPDTRVVICGTGPLRDELLARAAELGVDGHLTLTGLVDNRTVARYQEAADLFVLPSELEALPTVAVEALASGTPVISTDNPGGIELGRLFGDDVRVVRRSEPGELAAAIIAFLSNVRRTRASSDDVLAREFSPAVTAARFAAIYREVAGQPS